MRGPKALLLVGLLAVPFVLAACGSSSDNSADEAQITAVITRSATSGDPAVCTQDQTLRFTEQTSGGAKGAAAVKSCQQDAKNTSADKVDVTDIQVNGDTATAKAKATGSIFNGQTLNVALVKENGQWKLDEFKGFENFDKASLIAATKSRLSSEAGSTAQAVNCVVQQFQAASDQEIEGLYTGSDPNADAKIFGPCTKYFQG